MAERPLSILYSFANPLGAPGIGVTALQQINALQALGHRCVVYCTSSAVALPGVEVHHTLALGPARIRHRMLGQVRAWHMHDRLVARALRRRRDEFDVVHAWPQASLATFNAAADVGVVSFREAPNTHTANAMAVARDVTSDLGLQMPARHSHRYDIGRLAREEAEYAAADRILVPSDQVAATFTNRGIPEGRLARHRYGCDLNAFEPPRELRGHGEPTRFLFVGRVEPRKGVHLLARVWAEATHGTGAHLLIAGQMMPDYRGVLERLLASPNVTYLEFSSTVPRLMRTSDVLVLPSIEEGSALVTYEAQATGCALAVSDASGAFMQHGVHGLVHRASDTEQLARDIRRFAVDHSMRTQMQAASLADRDRLSWLEAGRRLADLYRAALECM